MRSGSAGRGCTHPLRRATPVDAGPGHPLASCPAGGPGTPAVGGWPGGSRRTDPRPHRPGRLRHRRSGVPRAADPLRRGLRAGRGGDHLARAPGPGRRGAGLPGVRLAGGPGRGRRGGGRGLHAGGHAGPRWCSTPCGSGWRWWRTSRSRWTRTAARETVELAVARGLVLTVFQNRRWDSDLLHRAAPARRGPAGRPAPAGVPVRALPAGPGARCGRRRDALRPRQPPRRPGAAACRAGAAGLRRGPRARPRRARRRRLPRAHPRGRRGLPPVGELPAGRAGAAVPGRRDRRDATSWEAWTGRRTGSRAGQTPAGLGRGWGEEPEATPGAGCTAGTRASPCPPSAARWDSFYPAFADAVRGRGPVPVDPLDAVATAAVLDAARRSATAGQVVALRA